MPRLAASLHSARKSSLTAEQRVDALVIAGIVAVIGIRLKDRIEINGGNVQALQIIQLGVYAAQRAAEKVVVEDFAVLIWQIDRNIVPVLVQHARSRLHPPAARVPCRGRNGPEKCCR